VSNAASCTRHAWHCFEVQQIEQFRNAVFGADLDAMQMAGPNLGGSLAFTASNGVIFSSGRIEGEVALHGLPSQDAITFLVNLRAGQGFLLLLNETRAGDVAFVPPGDNLDVHFAPGALYLAATISVQRLAQEAAVDGVIPERRTIPNCICLYRDAITHASLDWARSRIMRIHHGGSLADDELSKLEDILLRAAIRCLGETPEKADERMKLVRYGKIVQRAHGYVMWNLSSAITMPAIAANAATSPRTLIRAFVEILNVTPHVYVRLLRLNRIRRDLVSNTVTVRSISMIAQQWGINETGRLSGWYRDLFGESPSRTLARDRARIPSATF
jgi:AraC-like DNA-binding protein